MTAIVNGIMIEGRPDEIIEFIRLSSQTSFSSSVSGFELDDLKISKDNSIGKKNG